MGWQSFFESALSGATVLSIVAHAVNTFPVPDNKYVRWFLGCIQFAIGQKERSQNTFNNQDTVTVAQSKKPT